MKARRELAFEIGAAEDVEIVGGWALVQPAQRCVRDRSADGRSLSGHARPAGVDRPVAAADPEISKQR